MALTNDENKSLLSTLLNYEKNVAAKKVLLDQASVGEAKGIAQGNYDKAVGEQKKWILDNNDKLSNFWNTDVTSGYLGMYVAANNSKETNNVSWADIPPKPEIKEISVTTLNPTKIIDLAKLEDPDIDGKSSGGTSSLKEGEERFIMGASYSGTRGISIAEVSGVSTSIVHGKRVTWTSGDTFTKADGDDYILDVTCNDYGTKIKAGNIIFNRTTEKWENIMNAQSHHTATISQVQAVNNIGMLQSTIAIGAAQSAIACAAVQSAISIGYYQSTIKLGNKSLAFNLFSSTHTQNITLDDSVTINISDNRYTHDITKNTIQLSANNFYNVAANTVETFIATAKKHSETISGHDLLTEKAELNMTNLMKAIDSISNSVNNTKTALYNGGVIDERVEIMNKEVDVSLSLGEILVKNVKKCISEGNEIHM